MNVSKKTEKGFYSDIWRHPLSLGVITHMTQFQIEGGGLVQGVTKLITTLPSLVIENINIKVDLIHNI